MSGNIGNKQKGQPIQFGTSNKAENSQVDVLIKQLILSVFFDGTRNNRFNTEAVTFVMCKLS